MNRPWMKFHTRDWLDNKELRRCSPTSRAVLVDLMCLAAEGSVYGYLCDKVGPLDHAFMAARCFVSLPEFQSSIDELLRCERLHRNSKGIFISRMVRDEEIRCARAEGGKLSIGHPHTHPKGTLPFESEGTHVLKTTSRERTCADSDSVSSSDSKNLEQQLGFSEFPKTQSEVFTRFPTADVVLVGRIVDAAARSYLSVDNPKIASPTDEVFAAAVVAASAESRKQTSAALFLKTVPAVIGNWAKCGRAGAKVARTYTPPTKPEAINGAA